MSTYIYKNCEVTVTNAGEVYIECEWFDGDAQDAEDHIDALIAAEDGPSDDRHLDPESLPRFDDEYYDGLRRLK